MQSALPQPPAPTPTLDPAATLSERSVSPKEVKSTHSHTFVFIFVVVGLLFLMLLGAAWMRRVNKEKRSITHGQRQAEENATSSATSESVAMDERTPYTIDVANGVKKYINPAYGFAITYPAQEEPLEGDQPHVVYLTDTSVGELKLGSLSGNQVHVHYERILNDVQLSSNLLKFYMKYVDNLDIARKHCQLLLKPETDIAQLFDGPKLEQLFPSFYTAEELRGGPVGMSTKIQPEDGTTNDSFPNVVAREHACDIKHANANLFYSPRNEVGILVLTNEYEQSFFPDRNTAAKDLTNVHITFPSE